MASEIWRTVTGYSNYEVSNFGRVKSIRKSSRILKPIMKNDGYLKVNLSENGECKEWRIHRLVMNAFIGPCPDGYQVNHIDENKTNNHVDNLEYVTAKENANHGTRNARASASLTGLKRSKESCERIRKAARRRAKTVLCIETGETFVTAGDANKAVGISEGVKQACLGFQKTAGGYHWRYVS